MNSGQYTYIGSCFTPINYQSSIFSLHSAAGAYEEAIKYHKQELTISKEVNDRSSEAATHGNLAVAYQALGKQEMALVHYHSHLNIARELKDVAGESYA